VQGALFTQHEGVCAGWRRNCGICGAGTMGQGAETVGSYTRGRTRAPATSSAAAPAVVRARDGLVGGGVRRHVRCADCRCDRAGNVTFGARGTSRSVRQSCRNVESAYLTLVTGRKVGARRSAERRCIRWAACSALLMRARRCLRSAVRVYPLGCQRQVRTLETSRSVCRSAPDVSVVAGLVGARGRRYHAQKEGGRGARREREEDGAANVTFVAQRT